MLFEFFSKMFMFSKLCFPVPLLRRYFFKHTVPTPPWNRATDPIFESYFREMFKCLELYFPKLNIVPSVPSGFYRTI